MKKLALLLLLPVAFASQAQACDVRTADSVAVKADTVSIKADTIQTPVNNDKYYKLTDDDYQRVAEELGIDGCFKKLLTSSRGKSERNGRWNSWRTSRTRKIAFGSEAMKKE